MIEDKLMKLCRLWAQDSSIEVTVGEGKGKLEDFSTIYSKDPITKEMRINGINLSKHAHTFAKSGSFEEYRYCRFATWHESMHYINTSTDIVRTIMDLNVIRAAFNILEDYRIEEHGLIDYPGYINEQKFVRKSRLAQFKAMTKEGVADDLKSLFNYILNELHYNDGEAEYPSLQPMQDIKHRVDAVIKDARTKLTHKNPNSGNDVIRITEALSHILKDFADKNPEYKNELNNKGGTGEEFDGLNTESGSTQQTEETGTKYSSNETIQKEYQNMKSQLKIENNDECDCGGSEIEELNEAGVINIRLGASDSERYTTMRSKADIIYTTLKRSIMEIRKEYFEFSDMSGDEVETDMYLERQDNFYLNEEKRKPLNDVLLVLDISDSTHCVNTEYVSSLIALCEVLNDLKLRFGVYAFNELVSGKTLYVIKQKEEMYGTAVKSRLGGLKSGGRTPLASTMRSIHGVARRYKHIILFTDGQSTEDHNITKAQFHELYRMNQIVYVIGYAVPSKKNALKSYILSYVHPRHRVNCDVITNINTLSSTILRLIKRN